MKWATRYFSRTFSFEHFDWKSFFLIFLLGSTGLAVLHSATCGLDATVSPYFVKQLMGYGGGCVLYIFFSVVDIEVGKRVGYFLFFLLQALLLYTILRGFVGGGVRRWLLLPGGFHGQPSELCKIFLPFFLSYYFSDLYDAPRTIPVAPPFKDFIFPLGVVGANFFLIAYQPDLGTALLILLAGLVMMWVAGLTSRFFLCCFVGALLFSPVLWKKLKPYQQKRVLTFLGKGSCHKERYHIEQSIIAVGSGGIAGKGYLRGTQNKLLFLPEDHTDFIFSVVCEEMGFLGGAFVLLLFALLCFHLLSEIASFQLFNDQLLGVGLLLGIVGTACVNLCMVIGLLPVVGNPLPFFSYGRSCLWVAMAILGLLNNLVMKNRSGSCYKYS